MLQLVNEIPLAVGSTDVVPEMCKRSDTHKQSYNLRGSRQGVCEAQALLRFTGRDVTPGYRRCSLRRGIHRELIDQPMYPADDLESMDGGARSLRNGVRDENLARPTPTRRYVQIQMTPLT